MADKEGLLHLCRKIRRITAIILSAAILTYIPADSFANPAVKDSHYVISEIDDARAALENISGSKAILAAVYLVDSYVVRRRPDTYSERVARVGSGQSVYITGVDTDEGRNIWYKVTFSHDGNLLEGYVEREFIASSDERFLAWEDSYITTTDREDIRKLGDCSDVECFPDVYREALYELKRTHPNWTFVRQDININWSTVLYQESLNERSLISGSADSSYKKSPSTGTAGWYIPTEGILAYYLDPRNFLSESSVFMFEQETYNATTHTAGAVQKILNGTFMEGNVPDSGISYAQTFSDIGSELNASPIALASRVRQEQGVNGTSPLISGTYSGFEGYYNYFNIKANGSTKELIYKNGLTYAKNQGWNTRTKSLKGGAKIIAQNYILRGQDTLYLQKFDVDDSDNTLYTHQYMQNIAAPASESSTTYKAYNTAGLLDNPFVFKIPVYKNMPSGRCIKPNLKDVLSLDTNEISNLPVERSAVIVPYINGAQAVNVKMSYSSSDRNVATVDENGVVTGINPGSTVISVKKAVDETNTVKCKINVIKADIEADDVPVIDVHLTYFADQTLKDIRLPSGLSWENELLVPQVENGGYNIVFDPDPDRYNGMTLMVPVTVDRALMDSGMILPPDALNAQAGDVLDSVILPEGYVWIDREQDLPSEPGDYSFKALFCIDAERYEAVETELMVHVTQKTTSKPEEYVEPEEYEEEQESVDDTFTMIENTQKTAYTADETIKNDVNEEITLDEDSDTECVVQSVDVAVDTQEYEHPDEDPEYNELYITAGTDEDTVIADRTPEAKKMTEGIADKGVIEDRTSDSYTEFGSKMILLTIILIISVMMFAAALIYRRHKLADTEEDD